MLNFMKELFKKQQPAEQVRFCNRCGFVWKSDRHWLCPDCHGIDTQVAIDWHSVYINKMRREKRERYLASQNKQDKDHKIA